MNLKQQTQFGAIWMQIENMNFQIELYFVERGSKKDASQRKTKTNNFKSNNLLWRFQS
jgi:hypothetical protein